MFLATYRHAFEPHHAGDTPLREEQPCTSLEGSHQDVQVLADLLTVEQKCSIIKPSHHIGLPRQTKGSVVRHADTPC